MGTGKGSPAMTVQTAHDAVPAKVPLVTEPMGILGSLGAVRRNVLSIIPDIATRQPMVSGRTAKRWHMVMDPGAIRRILLENLDNYPKSLVTKNLLKPAIGESLFIAEGRIGAGSGAPLRRPFPIAM
jgi:hypothetical protein